VLVKPRDGSVEPSPARHQTVIVHVPRIEIAQIDGAGNLALLVNLPQSTMVVAIDVRCGTDDDSYIVQSARKTVSAPEPW
jgi:hypothetical protein